MYTREQLAISLFYASNTDEETGNKVATLTLQTTDTDGGVLHLEIPSFLETQIIPSVRVYKRCCFR